MFKMTDKKLLMVVIILAAVALLKSTKGRTLSEIAAVLAGA